MSGDYILAACVTIGLLGYLVYALIRPGNSDMTANGWIQIAIYCAAILVCVKPLGLYMARVFEGEIKFLEPVERALYRLCGVKGEEQHWTTYTIAMLAFSIAGFVSLYLMQRLQAVLPYNPQGMAAVTPDLSFNTSVSFVTNTNWQSYSGESTMSYLVQMLGLTVHNFLSRRHRHRAGHRPDPRLCPPLGQDPGQFLGRSDPLRTLYVLLPISIVIALVLVWQGVPQNLHSLYRRHRPGRHQADHRPGTGRLPGSDQDAGHQWRRLLQRQFGASL